MAETLDNVTEQTNNRSQAQTRFRTLLHDKIQHDPEMMAMLETITVGSASCSGVGSTGLSLRLAAVRQPFNQAAASSEATASRDPYSKEKPIVLVDLTGRIVEDDDL